MSKKTQAGEFYTCTCTPLYSLVVLMLIMQTSLKIVEARNHACEVTRSTIQVVDDCPDSEEKWKEAAARKNCAAYANQCKEPERLVYHCVINENVTEKLEVCAYVQNIVLGYCTYVSGNLILPNFRITCKTFLDNPCPDVYRSTEAYKYQGCYEQTKYLTTLSWFQVVGNRQSGSVAVTAASSVPTLIRNGKENTESRIPFYIIICLTVIICTGLCFCCLKKKRDHRKDYAYV